MANKKITDLSGITALQNNDKFLIANTTDNYSLKYETLNKAIKDDFGITSINKSISEHNTSINNLNKTVSLLTEKIRDISSTVSCTISALISCLATYASYPPNNTTEITGGYVHDLALSVNYISSQVKDSQVGTLAKTVKELVGISAGLSTMINSVSSEATSNNYGLIKIGFNGDDEHPTRKGVELTESGQAYVDIPSGIDYSDKINYLAEISSFYCEIDTDGNKTDLVAKNTGEIITLNDTVEDLTAKVAEIEETIGEHDEKIEEITSYVTSAIELNDDLSELTGGIVMDWVEENFLPKSSVAYQPLAYASAVKAESDAIIKHSLTNIKLAANARKTIDIDISDNVSAANISNVDYVDIGSNSIDILDYNLVKMKKAEDLIVKLSLTMKNLNAVETIIDNIDIYFK